MAEDTNLANPFFANAVHELRTPIQTIIGTLELMDETALDPEQAEYVRQVGVSADILLSLVNDLLDFSKLQSGKFKIEKIAINPVAVVESTVELMSIEAHNRGLEILSDIDYNLSGSYMGDPTRLQQVILNLVKNACKFTASGYVCVKLSPGNAENSMRFDILDSGIGVPDEKKELIFKDFVQADASTSRKYGGTGLGLSICKTLVTLMGGAIGVSDNPEGGSDFWFEIPFEKSHEPPENAPPVPNLAIQPDTRILVIDDSPLARKSILQKVRSLGATDCDSATSGEDGLSKLRLSAAAGKPYKIVLIDMVMPVMDGWRLASEINADRSINDLRMYLMVPEGKMGGEAKMKMLDWFNGYLYKPINRRKLVECLNDFSASTLDLEVAPASAEITVGHAAATVTTAVPVSAPPVTQTAIPAAASRSAAPPAGAASAQPAGTAEKTGAEEGPRFPFNILIAEDHPINQKLLRTFLEKFGATVVAANNGREAVESLAAHPETDLIFMDIQMPEMNGVEATDAIRAGGYTGIIVACTANNDEADFELYRSHGMNDILVKPFKKGTVQTVLEKWSAAITFTAKGADDGTADDVEELEELEEFEEVAEETYTSATDADSIITGLWNTEDMLDTVSHDYSLARQILELFISQTRTYLLSAKEAVYTQNFQSLARIGHSLIGSSGSVSAHTLEEAATRMEDAAKNQDIESVGAALNQFNAAFTKFEFIVGEIISTWGAT